ncbi:hypothetical protein FKM82_017858 [Ascaphus truei]
MWIAGNCSGKYSCCMSPLLLMASNSLQTPMGGPRQCEGLSYCCGLGRKSRSDLQYEVGERAKPVPTQRCFILILG